jgi:hypothetical protein
MVKNILIMLGDDFYVLDMLIHYYLNNKFSKIIICGPDCFVLKEYCLNKNILIEDIITTFNTSMSYKVINNNNYNHLYDGLVSSIIFCKKILNNLLKDYNIDDIPIIYLFLRHKELKRSAHLSSLILKKFPKIKIIYKKEILKEDEIKEEKELLKKFLSCNILY